MRAHGRSFASPSPLLSLAWRFSFAAPRTGPLRVGVTSVLSCVAVLLFFLGWAIISTFVHIETVAQARSWDRPTADKPAVARVDQRVIRFSDTPIEVIYVDPLVNDAAIRYPGLDTLPPAGEYAATPAAADLLRREGLTQIFPVTSELAPTGTASSGERLLVTRTPPGGRSGVKVSGFGSSAPQPPSTLPDVPLLGPIIGTIALVFLPAAALLAVSARLSQALRAHRLSLMNRLGARTTGRSIAAVEAALLTLPGAVAAMTIWFGLVARHDSSPLLALPLASTAWTISVAHVVIVAGAVGIAMGATWALAQPRRTVGAGSEERVPAWRGTVFGLGILLLLLVPWLGAAQRSTGFLLAFVVAALGVPLVLPLWFRAAGRRLRSREEWLTSWIVGARLQRFPRSWARGWTAPALACAVIGPVIVIASLNARGDTDLIAADAPPLQVYRASVSDPDALLAGQPESAVAVARSVEGQKRFVVGATCRQTAERVGIGSCDALRSQLAHSARWLANARFDPSARERETSSIIAIAKHKSEVLTTLATVADGKAPFFVTEVAPIRVHSSPLARWLMGGIGLASLVCVLAVMVMVVDRAMSSREKSGLGRIGLSLRRRRLLDAGAFAASSVVASAGGLCVSFLSAFALARTDVHAAIPWEALGITLVGVAAVTIVGSAAVAMGTTRGDTAKSVFD